MPPLTVHGQPLAPANLANAALAWEEVSKLGAAVSFTAACCLNDVSLHAVA